MEAFSRDTGYPEEFLKDIEDGKVAPPVAAVLQLSRFFNVDMEEFRVRAVKTLPGKGQQATRSGLHRTPISL